MTPYRNKSIKKKIKSLSFFCSGNHQPINVLVFFLKEVFYTDRATTRLKP